MASGLGEAIDDVELEGCVIGQLQDAVSFVRNNSHKKWWKEDDYREELPDYPERAVTEAIANAIIHRDYMQMGSEVHIDMYDDRLEIYSPGGMLDGKLIQQLNPINVPSKRRNPLLADFFSRLGLMERRGSGMKKIMDAYKQYERLIDCHVPEFTSDASEFHVILWNQNYDSKDSVKEDANDVEEFANEDGRFTNQQNEFIKEPVEFTKEFTKASRQIYKFISTNPKVSTAQMAESMGLSRRQVLKYIKRLQDLHKIARIGGRKAGEWKIIDEEYEGFFDRI
ncbi:MAG: winged helix-turn-helix transcriptional regulator [Bacteroidales bacterium]|nr:winged helix-turn-helix transcriptional regulator [Bacteroidales bacterium]